MDQTRSISREELGFQCHGVSLAGTVYLPAAAPPHPAVVMLQGSGPADRDMNGYFVPIRDAFLRHGIAVYSFDKPGIGASSGDWRQFALLGRADQAEAAIAVVQAHAAIDSHRVGVWGHSQGAWVVQLVASRASDLAFAIANSGPGISPVEQDLYGVEHTMLADGAPADHIARAIAFATALHEAAARADEYATVFRTLLQPALNEPWALYHAIADAEDWGFMRRFMAERYEPAVALARIQCPFLAIFGERDVLLPAHKSAEICGQALREAGNPDATIVIFVQGDHRIKLPDSPEFVPGYLDLLVDWTLRRTRRG